MFKRDELILLYHSERMKFLVAVQEQGFFSTHRGNLDFRDIQSKNFGDWVETQYGTRFCILKPTLADLVLKVKRTTTIVYPKDAGYLLMEGMVFPGARVIEVGSGSGALTTILASFVQPAGRVYSYERRPEFSANARENVRRYGLEQYCEFFVGDPVEQGFLQKDVDAVFLDVPEPWTLIPAAKAALKGGYPLIGLVPTCEQLRRFVSTLGAEGFVRIRAKEILERSYFLRETGIRPADRMVAHTVYLVLGNKANSPDVVSQVEVNESV
jgi:tRNA (adenine57-N1/adenine58-N1)-methyltransferase|uniref:tRNA (adenine(58)-N(1))-methyltransferase TrmI n=1 Tax=candidate division WOR-3 bacterium TaxID=2052148 RepID=A0A7V3V082_UNCW3